MERGSNKARRASGINADLTAVEESRKDSRNEGTSPNACSSATPSLSYNIIKGA